MFPEVRINEKGENSLIIAVNYRFYIDFGGAEDKPFRVMERTGPNQKGQEAMPPICFETFGEALDSFNSLSVGDATSEENEPEDNPTGPVITYFIADHFVELANEHNLKVIEHLHSLGATDEWICHMVYGQLTTEFADEINNYLGDFIY